MFKMLRHFFTNYFKKLTPMKRTFTKQYMLSNRGCYNRHEMLSTPFIDNKRITLKNLFDGLPIKDFTWFLVKKCDLTMTQKKLLALHCAKQVVPIYENRYPKDTRVRECVESVEQFINGEIDIDTLHEKAATYAANAANAAEYADNAAEYRQSIWEFVKTLK